MPSVISAALGRSDPRFTRESYPDPARRTRIMLAIGGMGIGGAEMVVRDLARSLDRTSFDVSICCTKGLGPLGRQLSSEGIDTFVLPGQQKGKTDYLTSVKLARAVKDRKIDVVHTHASTALFDASFCRALAPKVKIVHTFHYGNYPYDSWRHHMLEGFCARIVDRLVAVGWEQRRQILETYRLPESRVGVIWNGVEVGAPAEESEFRAAFGRNGHLLVGTIAKLIEQKGLDDLLAVARRCRDAGHRMRFVIVGEGPLRSMLEQRRQQLGLEDTVVITGWLPEAARRALPAFDVFFQPSRWEAMSIAVLEAMACGKPIVATTVGDNPRMVEHGTSGLLVSPHDIEGMASALARMSNPHLRAQLSKAARSRFEERFTLQHMVRNHEALYRALVA